MTDPHPPLPSSPEALEKLIAGKVTEGIDARVASIKRAAKWWLSGFGCLVAILIGTGLVRQENVFRSIHDSVFGFETSLNRSLERNIAVSYSHGFWLGLDPDVPQETLSFYADESQKVVAIIKIQHEGSGERHDVDIRLASSSESLFRSSEDKEFRLNLTKSLKEIPVDEAVKGTHLLAFSIADTGEVDEDRVFVRCLILVSGRDRGSP